MTACAFAWVAALLLLPVLVLLWLTESKSTRINRLKKTHTWKAIGDRYGVSASTARRWSLVQ
jgi:multidrug efflux pump subunit AcrB